MNIGLKLKRFLTIIVDDMFGHCRLN